MGTLIDLNRVSYMDAPDAHKRLSYLSARYKNIKFLLQAQDSYEVTSADAANLPGLAFRFYGDRDYWWVIGLYNGIIDPVTDLYPGRVLQLPSLTDINNLLSAESTKENDNTVVI